jgi:hypothetical protein
MSRGLGKLQRAALVALGDGEPRFTWQIVVAAYGLSGEEALSGSVVKESAVRRALAGLVNIGLVLDMGRGWRVDRGTAAPKLWVLAPVTDQGTQDNRGEMPTAGATDRAQAPQRKTLDFVK